MKSLLISALLLFAACIHSFGQKSAKTHNLMLSVYEDISLIPRSSRTIVTTKEDGTQDVRVTRGRIDYSLNNFKTDEDSVFTLLKQYYDAGWKLVSTSVIPIQRASGANDYLTRYFFSRKDDE
jgi:hypothetical protein